MLFFRSEHGTRCLSIVCKLLCISKIDNGLCESEILKKVCAFERLHARSKEREANALNPLQICVFAFYLKDGKSICSLSAVSVSAFFQRYIPKCMKLHIKIK